MNDLCKVFAKKKTTFGLAIQNGDKIFRNGIISINISLNICGVYFKLIENYVNPTHSFGTSIQFGGSVRPILFNPLTVVEKPY